MTFVLEVEGLHKVYPGRPPVEAVKDVSFAVREGEIVALLGPNGAGKTTTVKCILNLIRPTAGRVRVYGRDHKDLPHLYRHVAAVLEGNRNIYWRLTPRQNLEIFAAYAGVPPREARRIIDRWMAFFGLEDLNREARQLSRGQQQKVALAAALARHTPLLVLDEPTLGLDVEAKREMVALIRQLAQEESKTILLTSHQMDVVEALAHRVIIIQAGRIVTQDTPEGLRRLFDVRGYRLTVRLSDPKVLDALAARWQAKVEALVNGTAQLRVTLPDAASLYRLLDDLRDLGALLESLEKDLPDLEEAYMRIIVGRRPPATNPETTHNGRPTTHDRRTTTDD